MNRKIEENKSRSSLSIFQSLASALNCVIVIYNPKNLNEKLCVQNTGKGLIEETMKLRIIAEEHSCYCTCLYKYSDIVYASDNAPHFLFGEKELMEIAAKIPDNNVTEIYKHLSGDPQDATKKRSLADAILKSQEQALECKEIQAIKQIEEEKRKLVMQLRGGMRFAATMAKISDRKMRQRFNQLRMIADNPKEKRLFV